MQTTKTTAVLVASLALPLIVAAGWIVTGSLLGGLTLLGVCVVGSLISTALVLIFTTE